jgi:hypothetical protein
VVTLTSTVPPFVGAVAKISFCEITVTLEESFVPKETALAPSNPLPKIVTMEPPPAETVLGERAVTTGAPGTCALATTSSEATADLDVSSVIKLTRIQTATARTARWLHHQRREETVGPGDPLRTSSVELLDLAVVIRPMSFSTPNEPRVAETGRKPIPFRRPG